MRQLWAVYLLRFSRECSVLDIFPTDIKILQNTLNEIKSNNIYLFTDSHVYFMHLYLFVYVVKNAPLSAEVVAKSYIKRFSETYFDLV